MTTMQANNAANMPPTLSELFIDPAPGKKKRRAPVVSASEPRSEANNREATVYARRPDRAAAGEKVDKLPRADHVSKQNRTSRMRELQHNYVIDSRNKVEEASRRSGGSFKVRDHEHDRPLTTRQRIINFFRRSGKPRLYNDEHGDQKMKKYSDTVLSKHRNRRQENEALDSEQRRSRNRRGDSMDRNRNPIDEQRGRRNARKNEVRRDPSVEDLSRSKVRAPAPSALLVRQTSEGKGYTRKDDSHHPDNDDGYGSVISSCHSDERDRQQENAVVVKKSVKPTLTIDTIKSRDILSAIPRISYDDGTGNKPRAPRRKKRNAPRSLQSTPLKSTPAPYTTAQAPKIITYSAPSTPHRNTDYYVNPHASLGVIAENAPSQESVQRRKNAELAWVAQEIAESDAKRRLTFEHGHGHDWEKLTGIPEDSTQDEYEYDDAKLTFEQGLGYLP